MDKCRGSEGHRIRHGNFVVASAVASKSIGAIVFGGGDGHKNFEAGGMAILNRRAEGCREIPNEPETGWECPRSERPFSDANQAGRVIKPRASILEQRGEPQKADRPPQDVEIFVGGPPMAGLEGHGGLRSVDCNAPRGAWLARAKSIFMAEG